MTTTETTPSPDSPPVQPSRGNLYRQISELHERYMQLACGFLPPSSANRSARAEMQDLLAEINALYDAIKGMKK